MTTANDTDLIRQQIEALLREYPELADDDQLRLDMIMGETDIEEALVTLIVSEKEAEMMAVGIGFYVSQLNERRKRYDRRAEAYRELMLKLMQAANLRKVELPIATLSQRASHPAIVGHINPDELPDALCNITREASRSKIREALLKGDLIPGLTLSNGPPTLMIKVK